jgi:hypothetical protein
MASSFQAAVTPAGIRDGDPAALAALVERRANAVLAYCEAVCPPAVAERAAAEAFARFRAAVAAAEDPRSLDPETLLRGATRHAAASMTVTPAQTPIVGGFRGKLAAGRPTASETCALIPDLLAARADGALGSADQERLARHLERHAACRALEVAVERAEATYASPLPRTVPISALSEIMLALAAAAPITAPPVADFEFADVRVAEAQAPPEVVALQPEPDAAESPPETPREVDGPDAEAREPETLLPEAEGPEPDGRRLEEEAYPPEPEPEPEAEARRLDAEAHHPEPRLAVHPPEPEAYEPQPDPPTAYQPSTRANPVVLQTPEAYHPAAHPSAREPGPEPYQERSPAQDQPRAPEAGAYGPQVVPEQQPYDPSPEAGARVAGHTLAFPAASMTGEVAPSPGGVPLPRPPRRPLHLATTAGRHGVVYRYVLPGAAVAAALVVAMGVAGVFASDDTAPAAARPAGIDAPAAPPTGAPPVTPRTDVEAEERAAMAAQRRTRRARAAASARDRARRAAPAATVPTPSTQTEPPAVVIPEPGPQPTPKPPPTPRKSASTVEAKPPADSSSAPPATGTEPAPPPTPPAAPGVPEGTPPPTPPP